MRRQASPSDLTERLYTDEIADLERRFALARRSALRKVGALASEPDGAVGTRTAPRQEESWLTQLPESAFEALLDLVFEYARQLGLGFQRFHRLRLEHEALVELVEALNLPCARGPWTHLPETASFGLTRAGCGGHQSARACDYWREALDGLVLGLSDGRLHHRRHSSLGHGSERCVDVLTSEPRGAHRFGPLDRPLQETLSRVQSSLERLAPELRVEFLGLSEGRICYRVAAAPEGLAVKPMIERAVHRHRPELTLLDVSPRPVMVGD